MQTRSAILRGHGSKWDIENLQIDEPKAGEVLLRVAAAGLCHSDDLAVTGDVPRDYYPMCGGHEGSGVIEAVGPGVSGLAAGDHVVTSFIPSCGRCTWCAAGMQNLCDRGLAIMRGTQMDGTYRMHLDGVDVSGGTPTFTEFAVISQQAVIKIPEDIDLVTASLLSCAVPTGWGSAVNGAQVKPGDVVIVMGVGGVGMNAVQGAWMAGAERVIAVDPVTFKRTEALQFGATDTAATIEEATDLARSLTNGQGAHSTIVTVGIVEGEDITNAIASIAKNGIVVITGSGPKGTMDVPIDVFGLVMYQKRIQGALFGMCSPSSDIPRLIDLYRHGRLKLDELITTRYTLDEVNLGYADMHAGKNIRGVLVM